MELNEKASIVTPAEAGVQQGFETLDSRLRGNDSPTGGPTSVERVGQNRNANWAGHCDRQHQVFIKFQN
jgi:hypothetical protein